MNATTLLTVVTTLMEYVETNLSLTEITSIALAGLTIDLGGAQQLRIPVDGTYESGMYGNVWCIKPNFEKNARQLHSFIYG